MPLLIWIFVKRMSMLPVLDWFAVFCSKKDIVGGVYFVLI
jgi:hypothetical protein